MTLRTLGGEGRARWFDHASETDEVVAINVMDHAIQVNNRGSPRLFVHGPVTYVVEPIKAKRDKERFIAAFGGHASGRDRKIRRDRDRTECWILGKRGGDEGQEWNIGGLTEVE